LPLWLTIAEGLPFAKAQGIALGITISIAAIVSSILYLAADHPPTLDGKSLALEFELKIPPTLKMPTQASMQNLHASLYANDRDNRYALLDYDKIATRDGFVLLPAKRRCFPKRLTAIYWFRSRARAAPASSSS
jgi:hypothetical protein